MSGSKYETMAKAIEKKIEELDRGASDLVRQKQLEQQLKRIDKETERLIKEKKLTPVKSEEIKKDAELEYENTINNINRKVENDIDIINSEIKNLKLSYEQQLSTLEKRLSKVAEDSEIYKQRAEADAKRVLERKLSSVDNVDEVLAMEIEKIREDADKRKESIEIELDNVKAVNDSKTAKMEALDSLYNDIKEISLSLGDVKK